MRRVEKPTVEVSSWKRFPAFFDMLGQSSPNMQAWTPGCPRRSKQWRIHSRRRPFSQRPCRRNALHPPPLLPVVHHVGVVVVLFGRRRFDDRDDAPRSGTGGAGVPAHSACVSRDRDEGRGGGRDMPAGGEGDAGDGDADIELMLQTTAHRFGSVVAHGRGEKRGDGRWDRTRSRDREQRVGNPRIQTYARDAS